MSGPSQKPRIREDGLEAASLSALNAKMQSSTQIDNGDRAYMLTAIERIGAASSVLQGLRLRRGIDAEFLAYMREFLRIGEAAVAHHRAQRGEARLGED